MAYFSKQSWSIEDTNYRKLCDKMSPKDKELFFCDLKNLDWDEFFEDYVLGGRTYLISDPIETLEERRRKMRR